MLTLFRNLVRSKVAVVLIALLILSLALFGVPDFFGSILGKNLGSSLMRADSRRLEAADVDRFAQRMVDANRDQGGDLTKQQLAEQGQLDQIINLLSDNQIKLAYVDKLGVAAGRGEAVAWLRDFPSIKDEITGEIDPGLYQRFYVQQGFGREDDFVRVLLDDISLTNVDTALTAAAVPTQGMNDLWSLFQAENRNIAYFVYDLADLPEPVERPTVEEVQQFYQDRQDVLMSPERRQFSVIAVTQDDFLHKVTVEDDEVQNEYEAQADRFAGPATRHYSEIVYTSKVEAEAALGKLLGGEAPEQVGGVILEDQRSVEGVSLDTNFDKALFESPVGSWFGAVEMQTGQFALLKVSSETAGEKTPFEDVRELVRDELIRSRAKRMFERVIDDMDDAIGAGLPLEEMADILGSPVFTYPPVDARGRTKDGLPVRNLILLDGALRAGFERYLGDTSERQNTKDSYYVIRVDRIVDPAIPPLAEIQDDLGEAIFLNKQSEALTNYADAAMQRIREGQATITTEAIKLNKEVTRPSQPISRLTGQQQGYSQAALGQIFNAKLDEPFTAPLQTGAFIGVVEAINLPDATALAALRGASQAEVTPLMTRELESGFGALAADKVEVVLNPPKIDGYLNQFKDAE